MWNIRKRFRGEPQSFTVTCLAQARYLQINKFRLQYRAANLPILNSGWYTIKIEAL